MKLSTYVKIIVLGVFVLSVSGCSSIVAHSKQETPAPYAGTKSAIKKAKKSWYEYDFYGQFSIYAMDAPFSFIADTLLYPLDAYRLEQKKSEQ